uniref:Small ribosomal subunit protein uS3c n=1 Tax=Karenia mikimotoi TaxID=225107 RepID=A0A0U1V1V5_KARMI|nr:ribosomal protein S3 [Karenia mikimotoi]
MAQKVHPLGFRLGITKRSKSTWFARRGKFHKILRSDAKILKIWDELFVKSGKALQSQVVGLEIRRQVNLLQLNIRAGLPAQLLERDCAIFHELKKQINDLEGNLQCRVKLIKTLSAEASAIVAARQLADAIEKRVHYNRALTQVQRNLEEAMNPTQGQRARVRGFKIRVSGRLNGSEIARAAWVQQGKLPLQSLNADVEYHHEKVETKYGIIGVKVWVYSGRIIYRLPPLVF